MTNMTTMTELYSKQRLKYLKELSSLRKENNALYLMVDDLKGRIKEARRQCNGREEKYAEYLLTIFDLRKRNWKKHVK